MTNTPNRPDLDLNAIEQRAAAATPGPWGFYDGSNYADLAADLTMSSSSSYSYRQRVARLEDEDHWDDPAHEDHDEAQAHAQMAANAAFIAAARTDVPEMASEIRRLRAALKEIRHLHTDSPMGPCPLCINADAVVAGGDGLHPWPCPTARLTGAQDFDPPSFRAAQAASACPGFEKEHQGVSDAKRRLANCKHCGQPRTAHAAGVVVPAASEETTR